MIAIFPLPFKIQVAPCFTLMWISPLPTHGHVGIWQSVHAAAYDAQDSPRCKPSCSPYLNVNPEHTNQNITTLEVIFSFSKHITLEVIFSSFLLKATPCTQHSQSHSGQLICPSSIDGRLLMTPAFEALIHSKMVCYTQNHLLYSRIHHLNENKKLCMHTLPIHLKGPNFNK